MSAQDMDQSSNKILELQDNGEILEEEEEVQQNDLENEINKREYTIKTHQDKSTKILTNDPPTQT